MNFFHPDVQQALRDWWTTLDDHRGERAILRRARILQDLLEQNQHGRFVLDRFHRFLHEAGFHRPHDDLQLAYVAGILAQVKADVPSRTFAQQMAASEDGVPPVKEQRFERLLRIKETEHIREQLARILRVLDGHVNLLDLAQDVYRWHDPFRRNALLHRWGRDYYAELLRHEKPELTVPSEQLPSWARNHPAVSVQPGVKGEMARFDPAKLRKDWQRVKVAALAWWTQATAHYGSELAELRRCHLPDEARLLKGYHRLLRYAWWAGLLWDDMDDGQREARESRLSVVAGVLAHVRDHVGAMPFPEQMATPAPPQKRARVSGLRFRRLLQVDDQPTLFRTLVRTVYQLGRTADVSSLAGGGYFWNRHTRQHWAEGYYTTAPKDEV